MRTDPRTPSRSRPALLSSLRPQLLRPPWPLFHFLSGQHLFCLQVSAPLTFFQTPHRVCKAGASCPSGHNISVTMEPPRGS